MLKIHRGFLDWCPENKQWQKGDERLGGLPTKNTDVEEAIAKPEAVVSPYLPNDNDIEKKIMAKHG